jgi:uncharacterized surface protein with fasciclin (FAS1) repeats
VFLPENQERLTALLTRHVLPGRMTSGDLAGMTSAVATIGGAELDVDAGAGLAVGGARLTTADIAASNGVVHVIDAVFPPE